MPGRLTPVGVSSRATLAPQHLVMSRELLIGRLSEQEASSSIGPDPQTLFRMLCPELHESRLGRLAAYVPAAAHASLR